MLAAGRCVLFHDIQALLGWQCSVRATGSATCQWYQKLAYQFVNIEHSCRLIEATGRPCGSLRRQHGTIRCWWRSADPQGSRTIWSQPTTRRHGGGRPQMPHLDLWDGGLRVRPSPHTWPGAPQSRANHGAPTPLGRPSQPHRRKDKHSGFDGLAAATQGLFPGAVIFSGKPQAACALPRYCSTGAGTPRHVQPGELRKDVGTA